MWRVSLSRALARHIFGQDAMISALAEWHRWRCRRAINAVFALRGDRDHCAEAAAYEARQCAKRPDFVGTARRQGWM